MIDAPAAPVVLTAEERETAARLLDELQEHRLDVCLVPAPREAFQGHMIRMVFDANPSWYSRLARRLPSKSRSKPRRRFDPDIRRPLVERALARLARVGVARTRYDYHLLPVLGRVIPKGILP
jgi:hypothetical protein